MFGKMESGDFCDVSPMLFGRGRTVLPNVLRAVGFASGNANEGPAEIPECALERNRSAS